MKNMTWADLLALAMCISLPLCAIFWVLIEIAIILRRMQL